MNSNWLKSLGTGPSPMPDDWTRYHNGFFRTAVTFGRRPALARGDGIVYYATGTGLVFAVGAVTGYPYESTEKWTAEYRWVVDVQLESEREYIHDGVELDKLSVEARELRSTIKRRSHIRLSDAEFAAAKQLLC